MVVNHSKLFAVSGLLILLFCIFVGIGIARYQKANSCLDGRPPLKGFVVNIDTSQSQLLIEQSRKFADDNGFKFDLAYVTPSGKFRIDMIRKDVEIIVVSPFHPEEFEIGFYNYDCINPTFASNVEDLANDLKSFLSDIPNATITEGE